MAITGWRVGILPSYLCQWAGVGNPFGYDGPVIRSGCDAFGDAELTEARKESFNLQSALMLEFPMIPLYTESFDTAGR